MPPPERPTGLYERLASRWFRTFAPRLPRMDSAKPPAALAPYELVRIERSAAPGHLAGTWFPARAGTGPDEGAGGCAPGLSPEWNPVRGAVLLLPPWVQWGRSYFHRRGRLEALRRAGYHALTVDFPGRGGSGAPAGFFDRDAADALAGLARLADRATRTDATGRSLPLHVWGVSAGGYWAHIALACGDGDGDGSGGGRGVGGAMFEDVSPHLLEWADRASPAARLAHEAFRRLFPLADRFLDLRRHAPWLAARQVAYVSGERDAGVPPADTRELASLAGGSAHIVPDAGHLDSIKRAPRTVIETALETFAAAEEADRP